MSEKYSIKGKIKLIEATQEISDKFSKREFVITTTEDKYPQDIKLEFTKEKCVELDKFSVGDDVEVSFNIRGSEWKGKYFINLSAWKIEEAEAF